MYDKIQNKLKKEKKRKKKCQCSEEKKKKKPKKQWLLILPAFSLDLYLVNVSYFKVTI